MPAKASVASAIQIIGPDEEMDNLSLKLTDEELDVLEVMLQKQRAFTLGELQREINEDRKEKVGWRRMERILKTLISMEIAEESKPPNSDKRANSRVSLAPSFASRWRSRRLAMFKICAEHPKEPPKFIFGDSLAKFYLLRPNIEGIVEKKIKS